MNHPFQNLEDLPFPTLKATLEPMKPQAIAIILYFLPAELSSKLLLENTHYKKNEIMKKMELLSPLNRDAMEALAEIINSKINQKIARVQLDSKKILNNLIKYATPELKSCITSFATTTPIKETNFRPKISFEELSNVPDKYFQKLIKEVDRKTLLLAIKTESDRFLKKLYGNLSSSAQELLNSDREILGPVKKSDVIQAQQSIVKLAYNLEKKGLLVFQDSEEMI